MPDFTCLDENLFAKVAQTLLQHISSTHCNFKSALGPSILLLCVRLADVQMNGFINYCESGCVFADEIRGMARVFGRHMLASDNCQRAPCTCHVAQGYCRQERVRTTVIWRKYVGTGVRSKRRELWLRSSQRAGH